MTVVVRPSTAADQPFAFAVKRAGQHTEVLLTPEILDRLAPLEQPGFSIALAYFVQVSAGTNERSLLQSYDSDLAAFSDLSLGHAVLDRVARETGARL